MKIKILVLLGTLLFTGGLSVKSLEVNKRAPLVSPLVSDQFVLAMATVSAVTTETVLPSPTPSATPRPTQKVTPKPKPKPTPTPESSELINKLIDRYSNEYGLDPNVMRNMVICESGVNSRATNGVYAGLFQYDKATWIRIRSEMGKETDTELRYSAEEAIRTTCYAIAKGKKKLWPNCVP